MTHLLNVVRSFFCQFGVFPLEYFSVSFAERRERKEKQEVGGICSEKKLWRVVQGGKVSLVKNTRKKLTLLILNSKSNILSSRSVEINIITKRIADSFQAEA